MANTEVSVPAAAISIFDAAVYLGVSSDTVRRLVRGGAIPHARIGNSIRIRRVDLDGYLEERTSRHWQPVDGRGRRAAS